MGEAGIRRQARGLGSPRSKVRSPKSEVRGPESEVRGYVVLFLVDRVLNREFLVEAVSSWLLATCRQLLANGDQTCGL